MIVKLKPNDKIKALRSLKGISNNYNIPERIEIPQGTILKVPLTGTNRGDVFCDIIEGEPILHYRGRDPEILTVKLCSPAKVGLSEGHSVNCPYDLGSIDTNYWEVVTE